MDYNIIEVYLCFEGERLKTVAVMSERNGSVFGAISHNKTVAGYYYLSRYDTPDIYLFRRVAGGGRKLSKKEEGIYFPT